MKIESKRLILRDWQDKDVNDLVEGLNNIEVSKWMAELPCGVRHGYHAQTAMANKVVISC